MAFGDHTKKFGKYTYNLLNTAPTLEEAKQVAENARKYGFSRVRISRNPLSVLSKFDNKYWIWAGGLKRKGRKNLWDPAKGKWRKP